MKHVVVDVAEEGGIHQIRGRYGEIQRFSSRKRAFHRIATEAPPRLGGASGRGKYVNIATEPRTEDWGRTKVGPSLGVL